MEIYENKYNKLVNAIKVLQETNPSDEGIQNWVNDNVPELRESEDERIRKEIIAILQYKYEKFSKDPKYCNAPQWIAWLENQKEPELSEDFGEYVAELGKQFQEVSFAKLSRIAVRIKNWLEKQGEQPQGKTALEAIKEEKVDNQNRLNPTDEVESKFKVGDWIIDNCGYVWKIEGILNQFYILESVEGGESRPTIEWVNKTFHLWTIQDAKDGDALVASDDSVFIYAGSTDRHAQFYIALSKYGDFNTEGGNWEDKNCVKPATKEQRDLLFQKMKEAGYTFDFEKKELKKIEQKPAAWSKDYTERMGQIINYLTCQAKEEPTRKRTLLGWVSLLKSIFRKGLPEIQIPGTEAARKGIHRIMDVLDWAADKGRISDSDCEDYMILLSAYLPQPKPVWNEEDTFKVQRICKYLDEAKKYYADITEVRDCIDWLKSIKERIGG